MELTMENKTEFKDTLARQGIGINYDTDNGTAQLNISTTVRLDKQNVQELLSKIERLVPTKQVPMGDIEGTGKEDMDIKMVRLGSYFYSISVATKPRLIFGPISENSELSSDINTIKAMKECIFAEIRKRKPDEHSKK
jgi:hypothetical protein